MIWPCVAISKWQWKCQRMFIKCRKQAKGYHHIRTFLNRRDLILKYEVEFHNNFKLFRSTESTSFKTLLVFWIMFQVKLETCWPWFSNRKRLYRDFFWWHLNEQYNLTVTHVESRLYLFQTCNTLWFNMLV